MKSLRSLLGSGAVGCGSKNIWVVPAALLLSASALMISTAAAETDDPPPAPPGFETTAVETRVSPMPSARHKGSTTHEGRPVLGRRTARYASRRSMQSTPTFAPQPAPGMYGETGGVPGDVEYGLLPGETGPGGEVLVDGPHSPGCDCGACGAGCAEFWYVQLDALYFERQGQDDCSVFAPGFGLGESDAELATRITVGHQYDCCEGWEITFIGPFDWDSEESQFSAGGNLDSPFRAAAGINLEAFDDAVQHSTEYSSELSSFEYNRRWQAFDLIASHFGFRYVSLDEEFNFTSIDLDDEVGTYDIETQNHLFGVNLGYDIAYPIRPNWSVNAKAKVGAFVNFAEGESEVENDGILQIDNCASETGVAVLAEFGFYTTYRVRHNLTLMAGYEVWGITGVALAEDQIERRLDDGTGRELDRDGDLVLHGLTTGIEYAW